MKSKRELPVVVCGMILIGSLLQGCGRMRETQRSRSLNEEVSTTEHTYASIRSRIMVPQCMSCHGEDPDQGAPMLAAYSDVLAQVVPGNPEKSPLYIALADGNMPMEAPTLAANDLQSVYEWIKGGAEND